MTYSSQSVCVFCGSRLGTDDAYRNAARALGTALAGAGMRLVYGGGDAGLMGETARAAQAAHGHVTGVIPQHLVDREIGKSDVDDWIVTKDMHERKMTMFERSDAIVVLPGGPGTLDELMEVLTWRQLGLHEKPVVIVDVQGYWQPLQAMLEHVIAHGFADRSFLSYYTVVRTGEDAVQVIADQISARD